MTVHIEFVGVWDTVASVGLVPRYLPFAHTNNAIRFFRHAVALDEHRVKFMPNWYHNWDPIPNQTLPKGSIINGRWKEIEHGSPRYRQADIDNMMWAAHTNVKEVCFAGTELLDPISWAPYEH
jgi:uncharacterized protein (DUF2235 family)